MLLNQFKGMTMSCKDMMCSSKCKVCYDRGYSCCDTLVTFSNDELAKLYYCSDMIDKLGLGVYQVGRREFCLAKPEWVKKTGIEIDKHQCPFLDNKGKCSIYEYRPKICREYGETINCGFIGLSIEELEESSDDVLKFIVNNYRTKHDIKAAMNIMSSYGTGGIITIKPFSKKTLKQIRDDMFFYTMVSILHGLSEEQLAKYGAKERRVYNLIKINNKLTASMTIKYDVEVGSKYYILFETYNKIINKTQHKPPEYQKALVAKLNGIKSGIKVPDIEDTTYDGAELSIISAVMLIYKYYQDFKMKSGDYAGMSNSSKLFDIIRQFNKDHGSEVIFKPSKQYEAMNKYIDNFYKGIIRN